jgi:filamentous hemagglutinin
MPSDAFMRSKVQGYKRSEGVAMMLDQPPLAGRHRQTRTYGRRPDLSLSARQALARDIWDVRTIFREEGRYTPEIRFGLQETIRENKVAWPGTF